MMDEDLENKSMRVVDYIMHYLVEKGSDSIFLLTGNGAMYINDAIAKYDQLTYYCARHEAAAPMMAESYARLTGKLGIVCVTSGPGATNAVSGLAEAWVDSAPILVLSGQSPTDQMPKEDSINKVRGFGTAGFDIVPVVESMTKYAVTIKDSSTVRYHLEKAFHAATTGRPGPVWIDLPMDIQYAEINPENLESFEPELDVLPTSDEIKDIFLLLKESKKPLILGGHGLRQSKSLDKFNKLINQLQVPVAFSRLGHDILPYSHNLNLGQVGRRGQRYSKELLASADLVLVLGCRLAAPLAGEGLEHFDKNSKIIMVDIDPAELEFHKERLDMKVCGDVNLFIDKFLADFKLSEMPDWSAWLKSCRVLKEQNPMLVEEKLLKPKDPIDLYYFMSSLDKSSDENNVMTTDAGSNYYVGGQVYHFEKNQREVTSGAYAAMGLSIPLAIGAAVACPKKQILAVTGDGSLELNIQELKTISYYGFNIKLFVINNGGYVSMRKWQDKFFDGRRIGSDDETGAEMLNLELVAKTFEIPYKCIQKSNEVNGSLKEIMASSGPVFIEVVCDSMQDIIQPYLETEISS